MKIESVFAREILDSRGNPTIECVVRLDDGIVASASVPSGASVSAYEAVELRDGDEKRYGGQGMLKAINIVADEIEPLLIGRRPDVFTCDKLMREFDGTSNKAKLGANTILGVGIAVLRAQAAAQNREVYEVLQEYMGGKKLSLPKCMFNVLNGGAHANNGIAFQEFMVMPVGEYTFHDELRCATEIYHALKKLLQDGRYATTVGDEGGFAPRLQKKDQFPEQQALDLLMQAIHNAGYKAGDEVQICLDVAASQFYNKKENTYVFYGEKREARDMITFYAELMKSYPITSIEDGLAEDDWDGWQLLTKHQGERISLVGDDIFATNSSLIQKGIDQQVANAVLIKPNQIGSVTETLEAMKLCKANKLMQVVSHRSGETNDAFIVDLAVGANAERLKAGAPARGERVAKYNRLLAIADAVR